MQSLFRVLGYLKPYKDQVFVTLCLAVLTTLMDLIPPWLVMIIVDQLVEESGQTLVYGVVAGLVFVYFARNYSNHLRIRFNNRLEQKVVFDMRSEVYRALQKLSLNYFENSSPGELKTL